MTGAECRPNKTTEKMLGQWGYPDPIVKIAEGNIENFHSLPLFMRKS
jgi:hypothetical protein